MRSAGKGLPRRVPRALIAVGIAVGAALAAHGATRWAFTKNLVEPLELTTLDWRVRSQPVRAEESRIALVLFDSASVADWPYEQPFPRSVLADLIDAASAAGAAAIGVDVFLERRYPALDALDHGDQRLRDAIRRAGNVVLAAPTVGDDRERTLLRPDTFFANGAAAVAAADLPTPYETVRDAVLTVRTTDGLAPSWSLALFARAQGLALDSLLAAAQQSGTLTIPGLPAQYAALPRQDASQAKPVLFVGPPSRTDAEDGSFPTTSGALAPALASFSPEFFRDRVVLLGSGFHADDRFRTPFYNYRRANGQLAGWMYGVEIHANTLDNLLRGRHPVPLTTGQAVGLLLLLSLVVAGATFWRGASGGATAALLLLGGTLVGAWFAFGAGRLHVPVVAPTLAIVFSFLGATSYISVVEGKDKRMLRSAFGKYVSPAVVDQLVADPSRLRLGGEKRTISVLFSDLAGFTSLSETLDPERLLSLLNRYLDEMANIVLEEGGTLDKYIGDAVMALYGAPATQPDHAVRACRTALRMQRRLTELNHEWSSDRLPALHMRIGINTGTPVVGNIGGEKRFDYTALGDSVNLAARLEPACKSYGVAVMLAENTRQAAGNAIVTRELDLLAVYGKAEPIRVYELVALAGEPLGGRAELFEQFQNGLGAYRRRDFELAREYFRAAADLDPADGPTRLYLERTEEYLLHPPPEEWDFVERRQVK